MKILLVLNKPNREIPIMESIKAEILKLNANAIIEIQEMCLPGFNKFVFKFKPDVILTFPFTCKGFSRWYYLFKYFLGARILSLRAEGVVDFTSETNIEWAVGFDNYGNNLVDLELFWGEKLAKVVGLKLVEQNKLSSLENIRVVGYPRLETYFKFKRDINLPKRIQNVVSKFNRNKIVLLITGFHLANYTKQDLHDAKDLDVENKLNELLEGVEISKRYRAEWISNIITASLQNPDSLIIVKKHPIEKLSDYKELDGIKNILLIHEDIQVDEIIPSVGAFFHYGSTALVDAYLTNIPSIYVNSIKNKHWYSDLGWPSTEKIDVTEIPQTIKKYLDDKMNYSQSSDVKRILKEIFNLEIGLPYEPSKHIAKIILEDKPFIQIPLWDKHLLFSIIRTQVDPIYWKIIGAFKRLKKIFNCSRTSTSKVN